MNLATSRRWRPQNFDQVVGQNEVVSALENSIIMDRIHHAYMFSGPRGVGKTSLARIFAKSLNCVNGPTPNPCDTCQNCLEIKEGNSIDVIEIDGASNRKIDDIRNIRDSVKLVPAKSKYKIYIIDEVHMLTDEAFNALLKTLEEPPNHVVFILATTEPFKVKQTIRSRCQHFILKPISILDIFNQLKKISAAENIQLPDSILMKIAKSGNGSMRDSESMFDMVIAYLGDKVKKIDSITPEEILNIDKLLGTIDLSSIEKFFELLSNKKVAEMIKYIDELYMSGFDLKRFAEEMILFFRDLLMLKKFENEISLLYSTPDELEVIKKYKNEFSEEEIIFFQSILTKTLIEMRSSTNELLHFESVVFRIIDPDNVISLKKVLDEIKSLRLLLDSYDAYKRLASEKVLEIQENNVEEDPIDTVIRELELNNNTRSASEFSGREQIKKQYQDDTKDLKYFYKDATRKEQSKAQVMIKELFSAEEIFFTDKAKNLDKNNLKRGLPS